jgi:hypothetical protein
MDQEFAIRFAVSLTSIGAMVALAAWARIPRPCATLDSNEARRLLAVEFPDLSIQGLWLASDGAVARSGDQALVLFRLGDGYVSRAMDWSQALKARPAKNRLWFSFDDFAAPKAGLSLSPDWATQEPAQ